MVIAVLDKIKDLAHRHRDEIISIRHHLHAHPELSFNEKATAAFISAILNSWNIPHKTGVGGYGIVGVMQGRQDQDNGALTSGHKEKPQLQKQSRVVALRADMDALPITEENDVLYKSVYPGIMHACGHDVHSSALLGALKILSEMQEEFSGTIKFIFQPGEEKLPGGASLMIRDGVLESPRPDVIIAQHVFTPLRVGTAGFRPGMYMASADEIYITVNGKGGHAAEPQNVVNPLFIAAHLLVRLEAMMAEVAGSKIPTVLSFGKIVGAGATNIIPSEVTIDGTLRTMDAEWRNVVHKRLAEMISRFALESNTSVTINIERGYPPLVNNESVTLQCKNFAFQYLGNQNIADLDIRMAAEDFSFYAQQIPACFYRIGTGNSDKGITASVHHPNFNIDEDALELASGLMAWLALNLMDDTV